MSDKYQIVSMSRKNFSKYDEVRQIANFHVMEPHYIPEDYALLGVNYYRPDLDVPRTAKNDTLLAVYSNGKDKIKIRQGYFSADIFPDNEELLGGMIEVKRQIGKWVKGQTRYLEEPTITNPNPKKAWDNSYLQLGWVEFETGYRIQATNLSLEEMIKIGNDLK